MKDFLLRELAVDDFVVMINPSYRDLKLAKITAFTAKKVRVEWGDGKYQNMLQYPSQLVKVAGPDLSWFLLNQKG